MLACNCVFWEATGLFLYQMKGKLVAYTDYFWHNKFMFITKFITEASTFTYITLMHSVALYCVSLSNYLIFTNVSRVCKIAMKKYRMTQLNDLWTKVRRHSFQITGVHSSSSYHSCKHTNIKTDNSRIHKIRRVIR